MPREEQTNCWSWGDIGVCGPSKDVRCFLEYAMVECVAAGGVGGPGRLRRDGPWVSQRQSVRTSPSFFVKREVEGGGVGPRPAAPTVGVRLSPPRARPPATRRPALLRGM